jgi:hypothetical protein
MGPVGDCGLSGSSRDGCVDHNSLKRWRTGFSQFCMHERIRNLVSSPLRIALFLAVILYCPLVLCADRMLTNAIQIHPGLYFGITDDLDDLPNTPLREFFKDHLIESQKRTYYIVENRMAGDSPVLMNSEYPYEIHLYNTNQSLVPMTALGIASNSAVPRSRKRGESSRWINLNPAPQQARFNSFPKIAGDAMVRDYFKTTNAGSYLLEVRVRLWYQTNALLFPHLSEPIRLRYVVKSLDQRSK